MICVLITSIPPLVFIYKHQILNMKKTFLLVMILSLTANPLLFSQDCYHLVWSDEFDYTGVPSPESWNYDLGGGGWGNNELQNYTNHPDNSRVQDGKLIIQAIKEDGYWTSARLVTKNKVDFLYGRMEVRAKIPTGIGTWPAIWMLPKDWKYGDWPASGEIDVMEHVGYEPGVIHATVHTEAYNHAIGTQVGTSVTVPDFAAAFHDYTIEWTADKVDVYVDDQKYFTFNNDQTGNSATWPFDKRFHLILNIAIGGNWGGKLGIDSTLNAATMEIDYVRIYSRESGPEIKGPSSASPGETLIFEVPADPKATYQWLLPDGVKTTGETGAPEITVVWGEKAGNVSTTIVRPCGPATTSNHAVSIKKSFQK